MSLLPSHMTGRCAPAFWSCDETIIGDGELPLQHHGPTNGEPAPSYVPPLLPAHLAISLPFPKCTQILCACAVSPEGTVCRTRTCLVRVRWRRGPSITQGVKDTLTASQLGARRIPRQRLRDGMPVVHTQQINYVSVCSCARMCVQVCMRVFASFCYFFCIPLCCFVVGSSLSVSRTQPREIGRESVC